MNKKVSYADQYLSRTETTQNEFDNQGVIDTFFEQYWKILESWGFTYIGNEEGLYGTINKFRNDDKGITITYSVQPNLEQVDIILYYY